MADVEYTQKRRGRWKECAIAMTVIAVCLAVALIVVIIVKEREIDEIPVVPPCQTGEDSINLEQPDDPPIFADLTDKEMKGVYEYLLKQEDLNIVQGTQATVNSNYVYMIELFLPPKSEALLHLDENEVKPDRWAKVVLLNGGKDSPDVGEYRVGPLPNPNTHSLIEFANKRNPVEFEVRPLTGAEFKEVEERILEEVDEKLEQLLRESYEAKFRNCGDRCLTYFITPMSTSIYQRMTRNIWFWANHAVPYYSVHPLDLYILVNLDGTDVSKYHVAKVWYGQAVYESLEDLQTKYQEGQIRTVNVPFPNGTQEMFSSLRRRGDPPPKDELHRPFQIEPDGKRYTVQGQHVEYLGWSFDYRMSSSTGPMILDVRFGGERIAYEASLQEIAVFYSGYSAINRFCDFVDSTTLIGIMAKFLVPGADCPEHAIYLPSRHFSQGMDDPITFSNSFCLFEQNTGIPMRRHHSHSDKEGSFYGGMMDDVLVLRTMLTIINYDYIMDFVFHRNGALEVRAMSTGYILGNFYSESEDKYGFRLNDYLIANVHHHLFHFKVDIDVKGRENRFEALNIETETVPNDMWGPDPDYEQIKVNRQLFNTEKEAAYKFNFDKPKYLIFHNDEKKTKHGAPSAFRLFPAGISKQLLRPDKGHEQSISWARYQVAVTKQKDDEPQSSSLYGIFDGMNPAVKFQNYLEDDENIVDQDLVAWISLGVHHIPHTEDLPVTPTVGGHLQFFLLPYNYFSDEPSMSSRSNVYMETVKANATHPRHVKFEHDPDDPLEVSCVGTKNDFRKKVKEDENLLFVP